MEAPYAAARPAAWCVTADVHTVNGSLKTLLSLRVIVGKLK